MASDVDNINLRKVRVFSHTQVVFMVVAGMAAFALPFIPFPWQMNIFAIKDFLLTISIVLLGFVMASMSALIATIKAVAKKDFIRRVLMESPTNLYVGLLKSIRRLINCIFLNAILGLSLILYAPEEAKCIEEHRTLLNAFSGFVLAAMVICGFMIWLVAARFLKIMLHIKDPDIGD